MTAAAHAAEQLALLPDRDDWQVELRRAWCSTKRSRHERFEEAMRDPATAACIRNLAHARQQKGRHR